MTDQKQTAPTPEVKKARFITKRAGWIALNFFTPASEIKNVARYTGNSASRLWERLRVVTSGHKAGDYRPADWSQAVADCGLSAEMLARNFRINRWLWWSLMWLTCLPAVGMLAMCLLAAASGGISGTGWLRIGCVFLVLFMMSATSFVQALAASYRLWQLAEKRVSASEKGSFKDYLSESRWCRQVLSAGLF